MSMIPGWIRPFLFVCALYDVVLGTVFLIAFKPVFETFGVGLPNHPAYLQFGAAYVLIMGIGFWLVARAPGRNRDILKLCLLTKIAYFGIVFGYQMRGMMPGMWVPFAWCDVAMAIGVIAALRAIPAPDAAAGGAKAAA
jgi:hypothetical protein